jgi:hypothetical protein
MRAEGLFPRAEEDGGRTAPFPLTGYLAEQSSPARWDEKVGLSGCSKLDGRVMYVPPIVATKIEAEGIAAGSASSCAKRKLKTATAGRSSGHCGASIQKNNSSRSQPIHGRQIFLLTATCAFQWKWRTQKKRVVNHPNRHLRRRVKRHR